jgi:hypothetical protein
MPLAAHADYEALRHMKAMCAQDSGNSLSHRPKLPGDGSFQQLMARLEACPGAGRGGSRH